MILYFEKKLRHKNDKHQWSSSVGRAHILVSYWIITLAQLRTSYDQLHRLNRLTKKITDDFVGTWNSSTKVL